MASGVPPADGVPRREGVRPKIARMAGACPYREPDPPMTADPASLRAALRSRVMTMARECGDIRGGEVILELAAALSGASPAPEPEITRLRGELEACEQHVKILERQRGARPISGEPPAPTPEPDSRAVRIAKVYELWGPAFEAQAIAELPKLTTAAIKASGFLEEIDQRFALGVPPAAPTAATPRPEDDFGILAALDELVGYTLNGRGCSYQYVWDAISDWHRRTISGEPTKTYTLLSTVCACGVSSGNGYAVPGPSGECTWMCWECYHKLVDTSRG